jgi:hypothetical protein
MTYDMEDSIAEDEIFVPPLPSAEDLYVAGIIERFRNVTRYCEKILKDIALDASGKMFDIYESALHKQRGEDALLNFINIVMVEIAQMLPFGMLTIEQLREIYNNNFGIFVELFHSFATTTRIYETIGGRKRLVNKIVKPYVFIVPGELGA